MKKIQPIHVFAVMIGIAALLMTAFVVVALQEDKANDRQPMTIACYSGGKLILSENGTKVRTFRGETSFDNTRGERITSTADCTVSPLAMPRN